MVTTPNPPPHVPNDAEKLAIRAQELARVAIAGHPAGAIRRILLYAVVIVALWFASLPAAHIGLLALVLLVATDDLR